MDQKKKKNRGLLLGLVALFFLWPRKSSGLVGSVEISNLAAPLSTLFTRFDVVQSEVADEYGIEAQYEAPEEVFQNAKMLADHIVTPAYAWLVLPAYQGLGQERVSIGVNSWWRSQALIDKLIELADQGAPGIYSPSPDTTHKTGGTGDFDLFIDGENRNDIFMRALLSIAAPFDRVIMEHGSKERPSVLHIEYNPARSLEDQRRIIKWMDNSGNVEEISIEDAEDLFL